MRQIDHSAATRDGRDPGVGLWSLSAQCWVHCPVCDRAALVSRGRSPTQLSCTHCGHNERISGPYKAQTSGGPARNGRLPCVACGQALPKAWIGTRISGPVRKVIQCPGCGRRSNYTLYGMPPQVVAGVDPVFGLPLFLTTMVGKHELWALNPAHIALLEHYLSASLRRRTLGHGNMTMMARLPAWLKSARNRPQVVAGLKRLRAKAAALK